MYELVRTKRPTNAKEIRTSISNKYVGQFLQKPKNIILTEEIEDFS